MATVTTEHYRTYAPRPFTRAERDTTTVLFGMRQPSDDASFESTAVRVGGALADHDRD